MAMTAHLLKHLIRFRSSHIHCKSAACYQASRLVWFKSFTRFYTMNRVFVYTADKDTIHISFRYAAPGEHKRREYNFSRKKDETIGVTLSRINTNICNKLAKFYGKKKKKSGDDTVPIPQFEMRLLGAQSEIDKDLPNVSAWVNAEALCVGDSLYDVVIDPPTVHSLRVPTNIMCHFPVFPSFESGDIAERDTVFYWFVEVKEGRVSALEHSYNTTHNIVEILEEFPELRSGWRFVGKRMSYTPDSCDLGHRLLVVCIPRCGSREGRIERAEGSDHITAGPGACPFMLRQQHTGSVCGRESMRVMTYNILADLYADSDFSRGTLYPYCPAWALSSVYRRRVLSVEILGYNADLICLQEVDRKVYKSDLYPALRLVGFDGCYQAKAPQIPEGLAILFRKEKFRLVDYEHINYTISLQTDTDVRELLEMVKKVPELLTRLLERNNIMQLVVLERIDDGKLLFVANTHLFWAPDAGHIRLIQTEVALKHIQKIVDKYRDRASTPHIIFAGDFNSQPGQGVHTYMTSQSVSSDHPEWSSGVSESEHAPGVPLHQPYKFTSACGCPPYTNYVGCFNATLDWIFIHNLNVTRVVPMPSHEEVTQHTALPSVVFPSDHIALVCDVTWPT